MKHLEQERPILSAKEMEERLDDLAHFSPRTLRGLLIKLGKYSDENHNLILGEIEKELPTLLHPENAQKQAAFERYYSMVPEAAEGRMHAVRESLVNDQHFTELRQIPELRSVCRSLEEQVQYYCPEAEQMEREIGTDEERSRRIIRDLSVTLNNEKKSVAQAKVGLLSPDREVRQEVWRAIQDARMEVRPILNVFNGGMIRLREEASQRAGCDSYTKRVLDENIMSARSAMRFNLMVRKIVVPHAEEITQRQIRHLDLRSRVYPWDSCPSEWGHTGRKEGERPLAPFTTIDDLIEKTCIVFDRIHPPFANQLQLMREEGLLNLRSHLGKDPNAFSMQYPYPGLSYIQANLTMTHNSVVTLMHEAGHSLHTFLMRKDPLALRRNDGLDNVAMETAGMGMELLSIHHWDVFYPYKKDRKKAEVQLLEEYVRTLPWISLIDTFEQRLYINPDKSTEASVNNAFSKLMKQYYPSSICWDGLQKYRSNYWQQVESIFDNPFSDMDYGIAALGALQLYRNSLKENNYKETMTAFLRGLKLGARYPVSRVWKEMGIEYVKPFSPRFEGHLKSLMQFTMERINALDDRKRSA